MFTILIHSDELLEPNVFETCIEQFLSTRFQQQHQSLDVLLDYPVPMIKVSTTVQQS